LISLDKSTERPCENVKALHHLFGLQQSDSTSCIVLGEASKSFEPAPTPKDVWVFRWILKRFLVEKVKCDDICLDFRVWNLLALLVRRLSLPMVTRSMQGKLLLKIVSNTLHWLEHDRRQPQPTSTISFLCELVGESKTDHDQITGTSDLVEVTPNVAKKRKRGQKADEASRPFMIDGTRLFLCINRVLNNLRTKVDNCAEIHLMHAERVRAELQHENDDAAKLMGHALRITADIVASNKSSVIRSLSKFSPMLSGPLLQIWVGRVFLANETSRSSHFISFVSHCLFPALKLLSLCNLCTDGNLESFIDLRVLEEVIAFDVVLPFRNACLHRTQADTRIMKGFTHSLSELSECILVNALREKVGYQDLYVLLDIAFRAVSRETSGEIRAENYWLDAFFVLLSQCLHMKLSPAPPVQADRVQLEGLAVLLEAAAKRKLRFEHALLENIAIHTSGLSSVGPPDLVDWRLIALCLRLQPDFILQIPPVDNSDSEQHSPRNPTLSAVLTKIAALQTVEQSPSCKDFGALDQSSNQTQSPLISLVHEILLKIIDVHAVSRRLSSFLEAWTSHLGQPGSDENRLEPWLLHERILRAITAAMDTTMTTPQISQLVKGWLDSVGKDAEGFHRTLSVAELAAVNCAVNVSGSKRGSLDHLPVEVLLEQACLLLAGESCPEEHRWRVWRLVGDLLSNMRAESGQWVLRLFEVVSQKFNVLLASVEAATTNPALLNQALFAFWCILEAQSISTTAAFSKLLSSAISTMITSCTPENISSYQLRSFLSRPEWDLSGPAVKDGQELTLICASAMVANSRNLLT